MVGAEQLERFNGFTAAKIMGNGAPGVSSSAGDQGGRRGRQRPRCRPATTLPGPAGLPGKTHRSTSTAAFVFGIVMVFLILAAQYEKWSLPLAVIMAIPFGLLGALLAVLIRHMPNDIYFQIGLLVLIGLAAKTRS